MELENLKIIFNTPNLHGRDRKKSIIQATRAYMNIVINKELSDKSFIQQQIINIEYAFSQHSHKAN